MSKWQLYIGLTGALLALTSLGVLWGVFFLLMAFGTCVGEVLIIGGR
jgi:hypothetical protein